MKAVITAVLIVLMTPAVVNAGLRNNCRYRGINIDDQTSHNFPCENCQCDDGDLSCKVTCNGCMINNGTVPVGHAMEFYEECNRCICYNGTVSCTFAACPEQTCYRDGKSYDVGDTWDKGCLSCTCNDNVEITCSNENCEEPKVDGCRVDGKWYEDGEDFLKKCNTCTCRDGSVTCSMVMCPDGCNDGGKFYPKRSTWQSDCNTCTCVGDGQVQCTKRQCEGVGINSPNAPCLFNGLWWQTGEVFGDACNDCTCRDGFIACTQKNCEGACINNGTWVESGTMWQEDCNICICFEGKHSCTTEEC